MWSPHRATGASFPTDWSNVAFMITYLSDRAEACAGAEWAKRLIVCQSQALFSETLSKIFDYPTPGQEVAQALVGFTPKKMQSD